MSGSLYRGYRFPEEVISQCVWLYFNFAVSLREVELMMAQRGVQLSYETIRRWCNKFGTSYAAKLKCRRPKLGDKWFLDEVFLKINGVQHYLWRAVDQTGAVIDILVQPKRDRFAAMRFFRKLLRTSRCRPRVIITDKLRSYGAAKRIILPRVAHRQSRYLNNRAENSHQPTRQRERRMKRFKSPEHAQRFLETHDILAAHFRPKRHLLSAAAYQAERQNRFETWQQVIAA
ncbi:MAG: IS6 family transposase [Acidobacteriota bacterium]|nr:IS6 family transposase [Acidobacteriota bacterium]